MPPADADGWSDYRKYLINELERLAKAIENQGDKTERLFNILHDDLAEFKANDLSKIKVEIAMLQVKASIYGGAAGAIISAIVAAVALKVVH